MKKRLGPVFQRHTPVHGAHQMPCRRASPANQFGIGPVVWACTNGRQAVAGLCPRPVAAAKTHRRGPFPVQRGGVDSGRTAVDAKNRGWFFCDSPSKRLKAKRAARGGSESTYRPHAQADGSASGKPVFLPEQVVYESDTGGGCLTRRISASARRMSAGLLGPQRKSSTLQAILIQPAAHYGRYGSRP